MTRRRLVPPSPVQEALRVFGHQIRLARADKKMTAADLATRAMVSARTVTAIERGDPAVSIGNAFTVALCAGVPLFGAESHNELAMLRRIAQDKLALMPTRVVPERLGDDGLDF